MTANSWQQKKTYPVAITIIIVAAMLGIALLVVIVLGYIFNWDWTGLGPYIPPTKDSNFQRGKTLWDWLNLLGVLAIPAVVGLGAAWFTAQQGKVSDRENTDNQRETALQSYIDKISELLLHEHLGESASSHAQVIARARTVTVLRTLDPVRRGSLIRFLSQAGILTKCVEDALADIDLQGANLTGVNLNNINMKKANLRGANLWQASLQEANLSEANLQKAHLPYADLQGADLSFADMQGANLVGANLQGASLVEANLKRTLLYAAKITEEQWKKAKSLKGAYMPDQSIHP